MIRSLRRFMVLGLLISVFMLTACSQTAQNPPPTTAPTNVPAVPEPPKEPYTIGISGDLSGPGAYYGKPFLAGVKTYFFEVNRKGGVNGRQINVLAVDSQLDVPRAVTNVQDMVNNQKVIAISGLFISQQWNALAPLTDKLQVPMLAPGAGDDFVVPPSMRYLVGLPMMAQAELQVRFVADLAKQAGQTAPKVALITGDSAAAKDFRDRIKARAEANGWQVVDEQVVGVTATDVSAQAASIARQQPDYIFAFLHDGLAPLGVKGLRQRGIAVPIVNYTMGSSEIVFEKLDDDHYYSLRDFVWPTDDSAGAVEMLRLAEGSGEIAGTSNNIFTAGYVTAMLLAEAVKGCGAQCDGPGLNKAIDGITSVDSQGLSGPLGLGPQDHLLVDSARVYRWDRTKHRTVPVTEWIKAENR